MGLHYLARLSYSVLFVSLLQTVIGETQISVQTAEMTNVGSSLVKISQELKIPSVEKKEFEILSGSKYAKIGKKNGILTVASVMDREELCPDNREKCYVDVEVFILPADMKASPPSLQVVKVQIEVTDINDNTPTFDNAVIEKSVSEGVDVGTTIRLDSAKDPDLGTNSIQRYAIRSAKNSKFPVGRYFKLSVIQNIDGTKIPQLELKRSLDRERQGVHELILEASDGGTPALTGSATVRINVTDSNDNNPKFKQSSYVIEVNEHEENGTVVKQLHAEDKDTGINGQIRYHFPSVVSDEDQEIFALNSETGEISIKNSMKLDFETKRIHHLTVEANDMGPNSASDYTTVTVKVLDINDNKPDVGINFMYSELIKHDLDHDAIVQEDIEVGAYLAFVTVTDKDGGKNGSVSCTLEDNGAFLLQSIQENTSRFLLKLIGPLDREKKSLYNVDIEAWDQGSPPQRSVRTLRILVGDVNDNAPTFGNEEYYSVGVSETSKAGTVVTTLKAQDLDENPGPNSRITYELLPSRESILVNDKELLLTDVFEIDPDSGEIRLIIDGALDAETQEEPGFLIVSASDNGVPRRNATTKLKISILDENDNPPVFEKDVYIFHIKEHSMEGFFVGEVHAHDEDRAKDSNGLVTYNAVRYDEKNVQNNLDEDQWLQMFQIDREKGFIHFYGNKSNLDREARRGRPITISAVASDNGSPRLSDRARVDIFLEDINDNSPIVSFPDIKKDIAFVQVPLQRDSHLNTDVDASKEKSDSIFGGGTSHYTTEEDSKSVLWASMVRIKPSDMTNEGGAAPALTRIEAVDPDEGENAQISFALIDGNNHGYFEIDVTDGNITFAPDADLNFLKMGCHVLKIMVKDLGKDPKSTKTYANIFLSRSDPNHVNATEAMQKCRENPLYPVDQPIDKHLGLDRITVIIIIGFAVAILIILTVIVVILVKCKCCSNPNKTQTYNCQPEHSEMYNSSIYGNSKKAKRRKEKGNRYYGRSGQGTVDSRSSFHSEWTSSQAHIANEKMDIVGMLPTVHSEGSVGSHNSGRDSGTGDSMPSDAYHTVVPQMGELGYSLRGYSTQTPYTQQSDHRPSLPVYPQHISLNRSIMGNHEIDPQQLTNRGMMTTKCTEECLMYGHSDACWMPDSLLRPPSRLSSMKLQQQGAEDMKAAPRNMNNLGNEAAVMSDTATPYYYDPGRKFVQGGNRINDYPLYQSSTTDRKFSTFKDEDIGNYNIDDAKYRSGYQIPHQGAQNPSQSVSTLNARRSPYHMGGHSVYRMQGNPLTGRDRAYVNLQGYNTNHPSAHQPQSEEIHNHLSNASSNDIQNYDEYTHSGKPYFQDQNLPLHYLSYPEYVQTEPQYDQMPPEYSQTDTEFHPSYYKNVPHYGDSVQYEEDYSASNLLLNPAENQSTYRHARDRRDIPTNQQRYFSPTKQLHDEQNVGNQSYDGGPDEPEERRNLMGNSINDEDARHQLTDDSNAERKSAAEKLSTIEESDISGKLSAA